MSSYKESSSDGGGARGRSGYRRNNKDKEPKREIHKDLLEPLKVFVSNLRRQVNEYVLRDALSAHAAVEKVIIVKDKHTRRSKGYGFVKLKTEQDVEKLLALKSCERYLQGKEMVIKPAFKKINLPGDDDYVRQPLPERDFDLSLPDPTRPSIHMLVDDVLFNIFKYLSIRKLINCERVCRRWQMLVHQYFANRTSLEINDSIDIIQMVTKPVVSKLLILAGPSLRSLKVDKVDNALRDNILKVIGQTCPLLEHLDVTKVHGINFTHLSKLTAGCKNIKSFIAQHCLDFNDRAMQLLLNSYPQLEKLYIAGTGVKGSYFHLLPNTLKELSIERMPELISKMKSLTGIADRCPNLEYLDIKEYIGPTKSELEHFAKNCPNIKTLGLRLSSSDAIESLALFKNLKNLTIENEELVDLELILNCIPQIEVLALEMSAFRDKEVDFSKLENLKYLKLNQLLISYTFLTTLEKCKNLEELHLLRIITISEELILSIVKGCTKLRKFVYPSMDMSTDLLNGIDLIMKSRPGSIVFHVRNVEPCIAHAVYDMNKIKFEIAEKSRTYLDYDSDDFEFSDSSYDLWDDSDMGLDENYFSDEFDDDDLFNAAVMLAAWNMRSSDMY